MHGLDVAAHPIESKQRLANIWEQVAIDFQLTGLENPDYFLRLAGRNMPKADLYAMLARQHL